MNKKLNSGKLTYRAEIDGLRAVAIVSVILYHAKLVIFDREWFEGGFIGVDIFFVISGYLITRIILIEIYLNGSFSFLSFYERRARRILPMLFVVIIASIPYAHQHLSHSDFAEYAESMLACLFFVSNFFFYFSTTEYGADSALLKPFLHTWSLGVEEQFYLLFPIIAIGLYKFWRKQFLAILVGLSLLSLLFADLMEVWNKDLNFYLPFSRFWELAIGSIIAYRELNCKPSNEGLASRFLPILGLFLLIYSILFFDSKTPHPTYHTLIPIIGVALIIRFSSKHDSVGQVLGSTPFVGLGLISYSAYLWHFIIFAFSRQASLSHSNQDMLLWIAITFVLSIISYKFIESPIRDKNKVSTKLFVNMISAFFILISAVGVLIISGVVESSQTKLVNRFLDRGHFAREHKNFEVGYDYKFIKNNKPNILIVGNSHAEDLLKAMSFSWIAEKYNINLTSPAKRTSDMSYQIYCFWLYINNNITRCHREEFGPNLIEQYSAADIVVFASRWSSQQDIGALTRSIPVVLGDGKKVIVVGNTPESKTFGEKKLNRFDRFLFENSRLPSLRELYEIEEEFYNDFMTNEIKVNQRLMGIVKGFQRDDVVFKDRSEFMCDTDSNRCHMYFPQDKVKLLWDYGHTTTDGARVLGRLITEKQWLSDFIN
jgi:peptidoglycan/LPS O-acetylase OafA/YrhL